MPDQEEQNRPTIRKLAVVIDQSIARAKAIAALTYQVQLDLDPTASLSIKAALDKHMADYQEARHQMNQVYLDEEERPPEEIRQLVVVTQPIANYQVTLAQQAFEPYDLSELDRWQTKEKEFHRWMLLCMETIAAKGAIETCLKRADQLNDKEIRDLYRETARTLRNNAENDAGNITELPIPELGNIPENRQTIMMKALQALQQIRSITDSM